MSIARKILMGSSGGKKSTYVDDVFSTYVYNGNQTARSINNGIDLAGEGGLIWTKARNIAWQPHLVDTERGADERLATSTTAAESAYNNLGVTSFNSNGYSLGTDGSEGLVNYNTKTYVSWTFRKSPGFFDVVTWSGDNANGRQIPHNLGSVPGCIMVKKTSGAESWEVYHRETDATAPQNYRLRLNSNGPRLGTVWNNTAPTATHFTVSSYNNVNGVGDTYVAYIFAGGESPADTARSVNFARSSSQGLSLASTSDFAYGTGDFTVEAWIKLSTDTGTFYFVDHGGDNFSSGIMSNKWFYYNGSAGTQYGGNATENIGSWTHFAISRSSGTTKIFINGVERNSFSDTHNFPAQNTNIGHYQQSQHFLNGNISNLRIVKGTALYTTSFKPPYETLTNISGTVLLCCNNASVTGATVTPGAITAHNTPTASTDSPFDDPEGFQFGEEGDQNLVKCGTYDGVPGSPVNFEVEIGWEPQFFIVKNVGLDNANNEWLMWDSMRGVVAQIDPNTGGNDARLSPTENAAEYSGDDQIEFHPTGVRVTTNDGRVNGGTGQRLIYIAIRRPDGYVGKPALAGTDVFAMDAGAGSSTIPNFDSGFPVDFAFEKTIAGGNSWSTGARLIQNRYFYTNTNMAEGAWDKMVFDSNTGWNNHSSYGSGDQSWMWKRHSGFDVVTYTGNGTGGTKIYHSLNKSPEMIWIKNRTTGNNTGDWMVGHKDLYAGSSPWNGYLVLNKAQQEYSDQKPFYNVAPTSTVFTLDGWDRVNHNGSSYIAFLFASVAGISKCGYYTGSSSELTITTGFSPRFVIIKNRTNTGNNWTTGWFTFDTTRGWAAGNNDKRMRLNDGAAQTTEDWTNPISTGFTINANSGNQLNNNGEGYVYYAHA